MAELKWYKVKTAKGESKTIKALSMHDAVTKARIMFGNLPNDINNDISKKILSLLEDCLISIKDYSSRIKSESKSLDWCDVNSSIYDLAKYLEDTSSNIKGIAGSMVKEGK